MANTITKFQTQYLQNRLEDIKRDKIIKFNEEHQTEVESFFVTCYNLIKSGKLKLKSLKEVQEKGRGSYHYCPDVDDLFEVDKVRKEYEEARDAANKVSSEYSKKLDAAITSIIDSVVLQGLGIDEAIERFTNM